MTARKPIILKPCKWCGETIPVNGRVPSAYNLLKHCSVECQHKSQCKLPQDKADKQRIWREERKAREAKIYEISDAMKEALYGDWHIPSNVAELFPNTEPPKPNPYREFTKNKYTLTRLRVCRALG